MIYLGGQRDIEHNLMKILIISNIPIIEDITPYICLNPSDEPKNLWICSLQERGHDDFKREW